MTRSLNLGITAAAAAGLVFAFSYGTTPAQAEEVIYEEEVIEETYEEEIIEETYEEEVVEEYEETIEETVEESYEEY